MKREPQDVSEGSAEPRQIQPASVFRGPFVALMLRCGRHCWQATSCDIRDTQSVCRYLSFVGLTIPALAILNALRRRSKVPAAALATAQKLAAEKLGSK